MDNVFRDLYFVMSGARSDVARSLFPPKVGPGGDGRTGMGRGWEGGGGKGRGGEASGKGFGDVVCWGCRSSSRFVDHFVSCVVSFSVSFSFFFHLDCRVQTPSTNKQDNNPRRLTTLGFKFRKALLDLMELVDTCEPWYIRCIKPNDQKAANTFSSK